MVETNLGELLLTATEAMPQKVCLESEAAAYTFEHLALMVASIRKALRKALLKLELPQGASAEIRSHERRADEHVVIVLLERGVKNIAAVHAVMLERCAYNAFDVAEPVEKLRCWVAISCPPVMISTQAVLTGLRLNLSILGDFPRYVLDVDQALKSKHNPIAAKFDVEDLDRLAYIIFTSGSTGRPKGVMICHESALNVARVWGEAVGLCSNDRFAQISSMSWDVHIAEIYGAMAARATSVVCPDIVKQSGPDMLLWLRQWQITGMSVTPSHLRSMLPGDARVSDVNLPQLRVVDVGGEALGADVVSIWAPGRCLFNSYGPTEISVVCTGIDVQLGDPITIGPALPSYQCYILDPNSLTMKGCGELGVLFVGGVGLARGYLDEEKKTNEKFVEVPQLGRLFNTGDLVLKDFEGRMHYHGRVDFQVKVRGLRIELEALEQAIMELPTVKHCEARVLEGRLVLLASASIIQEAELKAKAASLGRGYVLSQVKLVEDAVWKFSAGGKLLRNMVPWGGAMKDPWAAFDKVGASALELEIAACVAPQVAAEHWDRNSNFVELGIDSTGMGQLLGQIRSKIKKTKLEKVNLRALFEHPTVSALAAFLEPGLQDSEDSDENHENLDKGGYGSHTEQNLLGAFLLRMQSNSHSICCQLPCSCLSYLQLFHLATAYERLLRITKGPEGPVAICLDLVTERMAAMLAVLMDARAFCVLDERHDLARQLKAFKAQAVLANSKESVWTQLTQLQEELQELCCIDVNRASLDSLALTSNTSARRREIHPDDPCFHCIFGSHQGVPTASAASHRAVLDLLSCWPQLTHVQLKLPKGASSASLALLKVLLCGGDVVDVGKLEAESAESLTLICEEFAVQDGSALPLPVLFADSAPFLVAGHEPKDSKDSRDSVVRQTKMSLGSSLPPGLLAATRVTGFGQTSWPVLCAWVQGAVILAEPVFVAARMAFVDRVLLPVTFIIPLWQSFLLLLVIITLEKFLRVFFLLAAKWLLVGRYREAKHDIYSLFYLRHWLVQRVADGTIIGADTPPGASVAFHFLRNLVLRALGANVALTSLISTRVVAFDLVSVGHLASVNSKNLAAISFGERKMVLKSISVGDGAFVGSKSVLEPGCELAPGAHVAGLSLVPCGRVSGHLSGVPVAVVGAPRSLPSDEVVRNFRTKAGIMAFPFIWLMAVPHALIACITVMVLHLEADAAEGPQGPQREERSHLDSLPQNILNFLPYLPLWSFSTTVLIMVLQLLTTVLICRLLPRVSPPCSYLLTSFRGQMVSLKMSWVNYASTLLQDASMVPVFMRMCGARFGRGASMAMQVTLPETLVVGNGCFIATRNILTSATVDQGHFKVPCITHLGDGCFVGNDNILEEGLPEGSFCGLNTFLPKRPHQKNMAYFGTPAMTFQRPKGTQRAQNAKHQEATTGRMAMLWYHFSTNVIDIFILGGFRGMVVTVSLATSRCCFPVITNASDAFVVILIYVAVNLKFWLAFSVVLGRVLHNKDARTNSAEYSSTVTRWYTSIMLQKHIFTSPFRTAGSRWIAHHFWLRGARIGKRFFCVHPNALIDAPFISIGEDVIVDYGADIRAHSFEDRRLKFSFVEIGDRVTLGAGAKVAMCNVGEGAVLRPASATWKGHNLEAGVVYEGAPATERTECVNV